MTDTPEFILADILAGVKQTQNTVTLYLDASKAAEALAAYEALSHASTDEVRSISEDTPQQDFKRIMDELEKHSLKVTLRALSNFEIMSVRSEVTQMYEAMLPKNPTAGQREDIQQRRDIALFEHYLSLAILNIEYVSNGATKSSLTRQEVESLRVHLPEAEWDKLTEAYLDTQVKVAAFEATAKDPTFRGHLTGE